MASEPSRQEPDAIPAKVVACLKPGEIRILLLPGVGLADGGMPCDVPARLVSPGLRLPNTPLWVRLDEGMDVERVWHRGEGAGLGSSGLAARQTPPAAPGGTIGEGAARARGKMRRVQVADALILLTAVAIGLAWGRDAWLTLLRGEETVLGFRGVEIPRPLEFAERLRHFTTGAARLLACGSMGVLLVRLRAPRPRRARLISQPGTVAVATATAYLVVVAAGFALAFLIRAKYKPSWSDYAGQAVPAYEIAQAIAAVWLVLAFAGRWRPERDWIDRLGIAIGLGWIGLRVGANLFDWW